MNRPILIFTLLLSILASCRKTSEDEGGAQLLDYGAYPYLTHHDGKFYLLTQNYSVDSILIRSSEDVASLSSVAPVGIWAARDAGMNNVYSPELHKIAGKWYIYFEADNGENTDYHQPYVLENSSENPLEGTWQLRGPIVTNEDWNFGLHPTTFEIAGRRYMLWSGWPTRRTETETQCLYIAEMENPWTLKSERVMISEPDHEWERQWINPDGSRTNYPIYVNENPEAFISPDGKMIVVGYSASGIWTDYTALGLLWASTDSDLLDPSSWHKKPEPSFRAEADAGFFGVSNISLTKDPDGPDYYLLYQTKRKDPQNNDNLNSIRWKKISWPEGDLPDFGKP